MADDSKTTSQLQRLLGPMADSIVARIKRERAEIEVEIAAVRESHTRTLGVLDAMREYARQQGDEIQRLRRRCALIEDRLERKPAA